MGVTYYKHQVEIVHKIIFSFSADVVLTSKHHEGWCNFDSSYHWNWDSVSLGPKRDLVMNLTSSVKKSGLIMGLYHSLREWYQPLYMEVSHIVEVYMDWSLI